jgi:hypothetical protein
MPKRGVTATAPGRRSTETPGCAETKPASKTTEFAVYLVTVAGVLIASNLVGETAGRGDPFTADKAWLYITLLTIGYLINRGWPRPAAATTMTPGNVGPGRHGDRWLGYTRSASAAISR